MASQTSSFMVGTIEVSTTVATATVSPTPSQSPPQSPPQTTTISSSSSPSPPPKKKKKTKRVVLNPQPISMVAPPSSPKPTSSPPSSPKTSKSPKPSTPKFPLQKDTPYPTIFCPGEVEPHKNKNFSQRIVPADIKLAPNNFKAVDSIPDDVEGYNHIFQYLWASPVKTAIKISSSAHYHHLLQEFWWTATYDEATQCIEGTVLRGRMIDFDVDTLRSALKLEYLKKGESYEAPATAEEWKEMLIECGYNFNVKDESKKEISNTPLKANLPGVYHYLLTHIINCLGGNSGSFNQANRYNMEIMHALVTGRRVDFAAIIFADMVHKVNSKSRTTSVPFSRFFSLMIRQQLGSILYHQKGYASMKPSQMTHNVFKTKANGHVAQLTPFIRKFLCKTFPDSYPTEDSLLVAQNNEDASVSTQTHSLSIPPKDASLIEPSARPTSPIHKKKRTRVKTHSPPPAVVKKRQQGSPKGSSSRSPSPLPRDDLGTQTSPPAVSKKAAGELKGKQQATPSKTSVGRGSEVKGLSRPIRVESIQEPQASHSQPSESAPHEESALSPADSEGAKAVPDEFADKTQSADKGPLSTTTASVSQVEISTDSDATDEEEESAESIDEMDFGIFLGGESKERRHSILADLPPYVSKEYVLRDEPTDEDEGSVEEVFEAAKKIITSPKQPSSFITNPFFSKTRGVSFPRTPPPSPPPAGIFDLPDPDTTIPQTFPSHIPEISTLPQTPSVSISTVPPSTTFQTSSASIAEAADEKPFTRPKYITLKDLVKKIERLSTAMETNCEAVVGLVDSQAQCHQEVLESNSVTDSQYIQMVQGINNLVDMFNQVHQLQQQVSSTLADDIHPAQQLVSSRFDKMAERQGILSSQFSELKTSIFSSINNLKEGLSGDKMEKSTLADLLKVVTALEKSTTCLVARVDKHLNESEVVKEGLIKMDNVMGEIIKKNNEQVIHLGKLTSAVNNLMGVVAEKQFAHEDKMKLDKVADDVSTILSILRNQQSSQPALVASPSIPISTVAAASDPAASKGEKSAMDAPMPDFPYKASSSVVEEEVADFPHQQVVSPATTKGEQTTDVEVLPVNVIEDNDSPLAAEESQIQRKGKKIDDSPAAAPSDPKKQRKIADKQAREVMLAQRQRVIEATDLFVKVKQGEGSASLDPQQLAAAIGTNVEEIEAATKLAHEMEANQSIIAKESFEALMEADDEVREEARSKNLSDQQAQILLEQISIKHRLAKNEKKKRDLETLRRKYLLLIDNRVAKQKITSVTVTAADQGKVLTMFVKRAGIGAIQTMANIQNSDLGVTEWVEVYLAVKDKTTTSYLKLMERMSIYFDQIRAMEAKLGITNSVLKIDLPSSNIVKPKVSRKRKAADPFISTSQQFDTFLASDGLINTNPPAGVTGNHGDVIKEPEHGMFFDTFHQGKRFFRVADVNLTTSETLVAMYNCCKETSKDVLFTSIINEELNKRKDDPIVKKFRYNR